MDDLNPQPLQAARQYGCTQPHSAALIAEQLRHTMHLLRAEITARLYGCTQLHSTALRQQVDRLQEMSDHRLSGLESCQKDHDDRLRKVTEGLTQFKVWSGLASGASSLISTFALICIIFGG